MNIPADIEDFFTRLERTGIAYMVGGSYASSAHGKPRSTNDIDVVLRIDESMIDAFFSEFEQDYMVSKPTIEQALQSDEWFRSFQIINYASLLRVDCFVPVSEPFAASEFARRRRIHIYPGLEVWVSSPEDIVIRKLQWFVLGGSKSDKQWNDIVGVLEARSGILDDAYLDLWSGTLGVKSLLNDARSQVVP